MSEIEGLTKTVANGFIFGAFRDSTLVGVLATERNASSVEFDFASIHPDHRGTGLASALGSLALLTYLREGRTVFTTGGAAVNEASKGTVESLGFEIHEKWRSYRKP